MDGYELFCELSFGTTFDPKQTKRRKNKNKNYKRNKRKRFEANNESEEDNTKNKHGPAEVEIQQSSDSSDSSSEQEVIKDQTPVVPNEKKKTKKRLSAMHLFKMRKEEVAHFRRINRIYVSGSDIPDPVEKFDHIVGDYDVEKCVLDNIEKLGYSTPTPIQMQAIPLMIHNRQILACAPTGSGKTAAFLIPIIHALKGPVKGGVRAVIIVPTRELMKQIHSFCIQLSEGTGLRTLVIEDVNSAKQKPKSLRKHDILVSTPNRLIYLLQNDPPLISLSKVQWLIVDECDKLFEVGKQGFRDQLAIIYKACDSADVKRAMFSATFSHDVEEWCKLNLDSLVSVSIGSKNTAVETIKQELLFVGCEGGKLLALRNLINEGFLPPVMIFVQSKERAQELYGELVYENVKIDVIHSDLTQAERDKVVNNFISGKVWILICTELMGRGIDFKGVNLVINYDFPPSAISYIHRIGRTGRAGEEGRAVTYFTTDDIENLRSIAQVMKNAGCDVPEYIMKLKKAPKKKKGEPIRPIIKRQKISCVPRYEIEKEMKKRKMIENSKKKLKKKVKS